MDFILNFSFAWISVILAVLLTIIFLLRKLINRSDKARELLAGLNKKLRKYHKFFGIALILTGLIHGLFSSESLFSPNLGTACWILSILLGVNYMLRKRIKVTKSWMYYHRILTAGFIFVMILHIYNVGIQAPSLLADAFTVSDANASTTIDNTSIESLNAQMEGVVLKDGVYEGAATGYRAGLVVSVEVKDNAIISIEIVDHNEKNSRYYAPAIAQIPDAIIESQSLAVDAVSGSTFTSVGIINAVIDALSQAVENGSLPDSLSLPTSRGRH